MRRLRGAARRSAGAVVPRARRRVFRPPRDHGRGPRGRWTAAPAAADLRRPRRGTMRLLHARIPGDRQGTARRASPSDARSDSRGAVRESLSLHRLSADFRSGRSGNRATGRPGAARDWSGRPTRGAPVNVIGKPRRRVDARAKVTGQTKFADDIMLPRMVHCKLLRSTVPHARIVRIDASRALAHPGVLLVLTGADLPVPYGILPVSEDEHALAADRVRFVGDPVAAVVARDELTA